MEKHFTTPDYWPLFSHVLQLFKLLGVFPVSLIKIKDKNVQKLEVKFSKGGFVIAVVLLIFSLIHAVWAPTMLVKLEKSVVAYISDPKKLNKSVTEVYQENTLNTKLGAVVKIFHPLLMSLTTLSARTLSVAVLAKSLPLVFRAFAQVDSCLSLPPDFYLVNFGYMTASTVLFLVLHLPIVVFHLWEVCPFRDFWEDVWEGFSMLNVFTGFVLELEFVLFCLSARCRFKYINQYLTSFISEEFLYDHRSGGRMKRAFSKWKGYVRPRDRRIYSSNIKAKEELFKLFSKLDAANGGRYLQTSTNVIDLERKKKHPEPETGRLLRSLRIGHVLLFDVLHHVNSAYQVHLLVSISSSVTEILFNFYFTIFGFITTRGDVPGRIQTGELYLISAWSVYYCLRFMLIVNVAHFTASASREAGKLISKVDPRKFEFSSQREIKMLSDHLSRRDFEFSACGLFNLNTSLISTSFSTGTTYLVIMAQFH